MDSPSHLVTRISTSSMTPAVLIEREKEGIKTEVDDVRPRIARVENSEEEEDKEREKEKTETERDDVRLLSNL